jgi:hypothetical protein
VIQGANIAEEELLLEEAFMGRSKKETGQLKERPACACRSIF